MPFLLISPFARTDYVSNTTADQSSILAFIEDNWLGGQRISSTSYDNLAGSVSDMFSWDHPNSGPFLLNPATGEVAGH
jgi:phospholipase C